VLDAVTRRPVRLGGREGSEGFAVFVNQPVRVRVVRPVEGEDVDGYLVVKQG
jgi:hypothetical protein